MIRDCQRNEPLTDKLEMYFFELKKLTQDEANDLSRELLDWLQFLSC